MDAVSKYLRYAPEKIGGGGLKKSFQTYMQLFGFRNHHHQHSSLSPTHQISADPIPSTIITTNPLILELPYFSIFQCSIVHTKLYLLYLSLLNGLWPGAFSCWNVMKVWLHDSLVGFIKWKVWFSLVILASKAVICIIIKWLFMSGMIH